MQIPLELIFAFAIGIVLMCLLGYLLLTPRRFLWRFAAGGVLGALALCVLNFFGDMVGVTVQVNPFTALAVGFLGLPGAALVVALQVLL